MVNPKIPVFEREEKVQPQPVPDVQSAYLQLAGSDNLMSTIGAKVAQSSSNALASQLGYEAGKNPHGNLSPSLTEFDKNFTESYNTQAHATLALQGQKLLDDSYIKLGKYPRLTPDIIAATNKEVQTGLTRIAQNAPVAVKTQLESNFSSKLLQQNTQYQEKMIREQREDQKNTTLNALEMNVKNILELSKNGNIKGAGDLVETVKKLSASGYNDRSLTPQEARVAIETAEQTKINGLAINEAIKAESVGKLGEYEKNLIDRKIPGTEKLTNQQLDAAGKAVNDEMAFRERLRSQQEIIDSRQMLNRIATNVGMITPQEFLDFKNKVSPDRYEQVKFHYIQALKKGQSDKLTQDRLIKNWGNAEAHANAKPDLQNKSFNTLVDSIETDAKNNGKSISHDEAQDQAAASAGATIPLFTDILKKKLNSGNPMQMESALLQMHELKAMKAGHALSGLNDEDKAIAAMYEVNRTSKDPITAAKDTIENIKNQDSDIMKMVNEKWVKNISSQNNKGNTNDTIAFNVAGFKAKDFINPTIATAYAASIFSKYQSYYQTLKGDDDLAKKLTKEWANENYAESRINGVRETTYHPLESILGFDSFDGVPAIHKDVVRQFNDSLQKQTFELPDKTKIPVKQAYDEKKTNEYWEFLPVSSENIGTFRDAYNPIKVVRHQRTAKGESADTYNVALQGNAFDSWDVSVLTPGGIRSLPQMNPSLGIATYKPDKDWIMDEYNGKHPKDNLLQEQTKSNVMAQTAAQTGIFGIPEYHANPELNISKETQKKISDVAGVVGEAVSSTLPVTGAKAIGQFLIPSAFASGNPKVDTSQFQLVKDWEGHKTDIGEPLLKAYKIKGDKWTIGWGHTKGVKEGDTLENKAEAEKLLAKDLKPLLQRIDKSDRDFNKNQIKALASFGMNEGKGALGKMIDFLESDPSDARIKRKFRLYNKQTNRETGEVRTLRGLKERREAEIEEYFKGD